jgi:cytochrome c peroxidase
VLWNRVSVGQGPEALAIVGDRIYATEKFDDSIAALDLAGSKIDRIRLMSDRSLTPVERGEIAFFDARHSLEGWYSCHSCHSYGHTSGRLNDNFTDGSFGTPKRVLSLRGTGDTGPWAWNGQMKTLEEQTRNSIKSTMQGSKSPRPEVVSDLVAYLKSLPPAPSLRTARGESDPAIEKRGRKIFVREKCASCHAPPTYTTPKTYDVGLVDEVGGKLFNPPSLRGVSQGGPHFHDGRAATLEDVFAKHRHELSRPLEPGELADLVYYLRGL